MTAFTPVFRGWNWREIYTRLGLRDPADYALDVRVARRILLGSRVLKRDRNRCTGRTTLIAAEAAAMALNGRDVYMRGRNADFSRILRDQVVDMVLQASEVAFGRRDYEAARRVHAAASRQLTLSSRMQRRGFCLVCDHDDP